MIQWIKSQKIRWRERMALLNDEQAFHTRVNLGLSSILLFMLCIWTPIRHAITPLHPIAALMNLLSTALLLYTIWNNFHRPDKNRGPYAILLVIHMLVLPAAIFNGGIKAPIVPLILFCPIFAEILVHRRASVAVAMIDALFLSTIYYAQKKQWLPPPMFRTIEAELNSRMLLLLAILGVSFAFGIYFEKIRERASQAMQDRMEVTKNLAAIEAIQSMVTTYNHEINNPLCVASLTLERAIQRGSVNLTDAQKSLEALKRVELVILKIRSLEDAAHFSRKEYAHGSQMIELKDLDISKAS